MRRSKFLFFYFLSCVGLFAGPKNPQVVAGQATFEARGSDLQIHATDRSIIQWESFSIGKGEGAHFLLPSERAAVLNRVTGGNPSELFGTLRSNGQVYLINPNGIFIGKEGLIQVGSFLASTLDCKNEDFLHGHDLLFAGSGKITNVGTIFAESVALLAQEVKNSGAIHASSIAIGAGREVLYLPYGDERVQIQLSKLEWESEVGIEQFGELHAKKISLQADGNLYACAINCQGIIEANQIMLKGEEGYVCYSGQIKGTEAQVLGKYVHLKEGALIDVSETALIGGDFQGKNPAILNAKATVVEKGVKILADAGENGDGGKVIVWANDVTGFYGYISARGGKENGNGGFVEVSGKEQLDFNGLVNTTAPFGKAGTLLLDPTDITISSAATDAGITFGAGCGANTYCNTGVLSPRNINDAAILANLALGNVIINSTAGGPAGGNGDISFTTAFAWAGANTNTFTLNARRNITFTAGFSNTTTAGNFICNTGTGVTGLLTIPAGITVSHSSTGSIQLLANAVATSDLTISGALNVSNGPLTITVADDFNLTAGTGSITFNSAGQTFNYSNTVATNPQANFNGTVTITNGSVNMTTPGPMTISGFTTAGSGTITLSAGTTFATTAATAFSHGSSGSCSISGGTTSTFGGTLATTAGAGSMLVTAGTNAVFNDIVTHNSTSNNFTCNAGTSATFNASFTNSSTTGTTTINSGLTSLGVLTIAAGTTFAHTSTGDINLLSSPTAGSDITVSGALNVSNANLSMTIVDDFTLTAATGSINYNAPGKTFSLTTTAASGTVANVNGPVTINGIVNWSVGGGTLTINDMFTTSGTGTVTLQSSGTLSTGASSTISHGSTGDISLTSTTADISIGSSFTVPSSNATFFPSDDFTLTAAGTINFSAANKLLLFQKGPTTTDTFTGAVSVTAGNMTVNANDTITVSANTGSITYNVPGGALLFNASGGATPNVAMNGTLTIPNGSFTATIGNNFTFGAASTFSYSSSSPLNITAGGTIGLNGTTTLSNGSHTMTGGTFSTAGTLTYSSASPWIVTATTSTIAMNATANITNGAVSMTALTNFSTGAASNTTYTSPLPWTVVATTGTATLGGTTTLTTAAPFTITAAGAMTIDGFVRNSSTGNLIFTCGGTFLIGEVNNSNACQIGSAGGLTQLTIGGNLLVISSQTTPNGFATIGFSSGGQSGSIVINVTGDANIQAFRTANASIESPSTLTMSVGGALSLSTDIFPAQTGNAFIQTQNTSHIAVNDLTLAGATGGGAAFIETLGGKLTVLSNLDAVLTLNSYIRNSGSGKLFLVVDQQAPFPPQVGNGQFNLGETSFLSTAGGDLSIFTANPHQNSIEGLINGATLAEGTQIFGVWFSTFPNNDPPPFTIYYKGETNSAVIINDINVATAEVLQNGLTRAIGWSDSFWGTYWSYEEGEWTSHSLIYRKPFEYPLLSSDDQPELEPKKKKSQKLKTRLKWTRGSLLP